MDAAFTSVFISCLSAEISTSPIFTVELSNSNFNVRICPLFKEISCVSFLYPIKVSAILCSPAGIFESVYIPFKSV